MFAGRRVLRAVVGQQQRAASSMAPALDSDDVFELATVAFRANASKGSCDTTAVAEFEAVIPRLHQLTPLQAAELAVGPWPHHWGSTGQYGNAMTILRELIHDAAPSMNGHEAALVFVVLCSRNAATAFRANLIAHQKELLQRHNGQQLRSGVTYFTAFMQRLLKVVVYHINDIKTTELLLNLTQTARRLSSPADVQRFDVPPGFFELLCRRLLAHDRMHRLSAEQAYRGLMALSPVISNKEQLVPFLTAIVRQTTESFLKSRDGNDDRAATFVSKLRRGAAASDVVVSPNTATTAWSIACDRLELHSSLSPRQWLNLLEGASKNLPRMHFRVFYPLMKDLILPLVSESNALFITDFVKIMSSANVRNELMLSAVMRRCVELKQLKAQPADSLKPHEKYLGQVSLKVILDIFDLLAVAPHVVKDSVEVPTFLSLAIEMVENLVDDLEPHKLMVITKMMYRVCKPCLELEGKLKKSNAAISADDMSKGSITDDLKVERLNSLVVQPLVDCVAETIARRLLRLFKYHLCGIRVAENFLDFALMLRCRDQPAVSELLAQFRASHDSIAANRTKLASGEISSIERKEYSRGSRELFVKMSQFCLQMNAQGANLPTNRQESFELLMRSYRTQEILNAIHLRIALSSPVSSSQRRVVNPVPPMLAGFAVSQIMRDADSFSRTVGTDKFNRNRARDFLHSVALIRGECEDIASRLDVSHAFTCLYNYLADMETKGLLGGEPVAAAPIINAEATEEQEEASHDAAAVSPAAEEEAAPAEAAAAEEAAPTEAAAEESAAPVETESSPVENAETAPDAEPKSD